MNTWDRAPEDPALAAARLLLHALDEEPPDVLVFGESTLLFVGPDETDRRSLADVLADLLRPRSTFVAAGPGFGVELHREFIRLAATRTPRPVVVTSLYARGTLPAFLHHPQWGHRRQIELLSREGGVSPDAIGGPYVLPDPEEWAAYEDLVYPTFVADRAIADFMAALRPPPNPYSREHMRWLFEFHFAGSPDPSAVQAFTDYGRALREAGFPVVAFQNPVDVVQGADLLGPEFVPWHRNNTDAVRDAFVAGYGDEAVVLETADLWLPGDFVEPAVEHLGAAARIGLADLIAGAVVAWPGR